MTSVLACSPFPSHPTAQVFRPQVQGAALSVTTLARPGPTAEEAAGEVRRVQLPLPGRHVLRVRHLGSAGRDDAVSGGGEVKGDWGWEGGRKRLVRTVMWISSD